MKLLVIVLWFVFLAVMAWLFERETKWISRFSIFTALLGALFVRFGVAVPFDDKVNIDHTHIPISHTQLVNYYIAVVIVYLGIYAGVLLVGRRLGWAGGDQRQAMPVDTRVLLLAGAALLGLVTLVWIVLPWRFFASGLSALLSFHHTAAQARGQRVSYGDATHFSVSAINYIGSFARFALMPVMLWVLYFHRGLSRWLRAFFWASLAVLAVIGFLSGQKLPILLLLIGYGVARVLAAGRPTIFTWRFAAGAVAFVTVLLPALYHLALPALNYPNLLFPTAIYRLAAEYNRVAQLRFIYYPDLHPFLLGTSSSMVRGALHVLGISTAGSQSPETYLPLQILGPSYGGTWNAGFFADAWADFAFPGVIVASLAVGVIVALIHRWYLRSGQGPLQMGTYTALCLSALYVTEVALPTALWTFGLVSGFLVYVVLRQFPQRGRVQADPPMQAHAASGRAASV
jgi:hypothetical protein